MSRKRLYATKAEKKKACEEAFKAAHGGLSYGGWYYRLKHNLPLDAPKLIGRRPSPNKPILPKPKKVVVSGAEGKPAECVIGPAEGRPEVCSKCPGGLYLKCLSWASDRNLRGWRIK